MQSRPSHTWEPRTILGIKESQCEAVRITHRVPLLCKNMGLTPYTRYADGVRKESQTMSDVEGIDSLGQPILKTGTEVATSCLSAVSDSELLCPSQRTRVLRRPCKLVWCRF